MPSKALGTIPPKIWNYPLEECAIPMPHWYLGMSSAALAGGGEAVAAAAAAKEKKTHHVELVSSLTVVAVEVLEASPCSLEQYYH